MKYEKSFIVLFFIIASLATFSQTAFSIQGTLKGQVVDGFENKLKDVVITIMKTKETTKSDENGQYEIRYTPGQIEISFEKRDTQFENSPSTFMNHLKYRCKN